MEQSSAFGHTRGSFPSPGLQVPHSDRPHRAQVNVCACVCVRA